MIEDCMNDPLRVEAHTLGTEVTINQLRRQLAEVTQQRDELRDLAKCYLSVDGSSGTYSASACYDIRKQLKAALAKVGAGGTAPEGHNAELMGGASRRPD